MEVDPPATTTKYPLFQNPRLKMRQKDNTKLLKKCKMLKLENEAFGRKMKNKNYVESFFDSFHLDSTHALLLIVQNV
jgi:hypothetical protein